MNTSTSIVVTMSLSILLHSAAFAGFVLVYSNAITLSEGVGKGVDIQLISSILISDQQESSHFDADLAAQTKNSFDSIQKAQAHKVVSVSSNVEKSLTEVLVDKKQPDSEQVNQQQGDMQNQPILNIGESVAKNAQSTNASGRQHSIRELLHSSISNNKEYPYLARRQRRQGVATVSFVLHPDGSIENAHLVASSHAMALDRAALSAVKKIEPFVAAQDYLDQSEKFQVDVEFNLL